MAEGARAKVMAKAARDVLLMARVAPGMVRTGLVMVRIAPDMVRTGHVTARTNPTMGRIVQGTARIVPDTARTVPGTVRTAPGMTKRSRITDRIVQGMARTVPDSMKTGLATITIGHTSIIITTSPASALTAGAPHFTATDEAGINQMISRRPQIDNSLLSDNDNVPTPIKEEIRLNKFIANSGVCSRREADTLIQAGVVTVNGEVVTELGTKVNVLKDEIRFNGERLKGEEKIYIVMNKPKGFVTSASDPHAEKTVMDLIKGCSARVFPVGRLDKNTTGVLMFTNDGEIAEQLTHPSFNKKKIYQVILDKALDESDKEKILVDGLELSDGVIKADELEYIDAKNRIVRRIFESMGYTVKALDRVYFAGLTKKGLKKGEWRYLSEGEINVLRMGAYV